MVETIQKTKRIGGSLMITIPKEVIETEGIEQGEMVEIDIKKLRKSWFGITPELKPFTKEDRMKSHYE